MPVRETENALLSFSHLSLLIFYKNIPNNLNNYSRSDGTVLHHVQLTKHFRKTDAVSLLAMLSCKGLTIVVEG